MNEQQKRFADYYIECGNATDAYKKAGYKARGKSAEVNASRLLANAKVQKYVRESMAKKDNERIASQDEVLEFLTKVMRGEITEEIPLGLGMGEQRLVDKEMSAKERVKAAELLGKRYVMWTDKQQVDSTQQVVIVEDLDD